MTCASSHKPNFLALTRIVNGAIKTTFDQHPEYSQLPPDKLASIRVSMTKRIVGHLLAHDVTPRPSPGILPTPTKLPTKGNTP